MVSAKMIGFLKNEWLPQVFCSQSSFITSKLALVIDVYKLSFAIQKSSLKTKTNFSPAFFSSAHNNFSFFTLFDVNNKYKKVC